MLESKEKRSAEAIKTISARNRIRGVVDAFENVYTGAGTSRSKLSGANYVRNDLLTMEELETLFQDHDLAYKIVAKPVEDMLRGGFEVEREGSEDEQLTEEEEETICSEMERLGADQKMADGAIFGRLFGAAGVVVGARGAGRLDQPLDDSKVTKLEWLVPFDRQDLTPTKWDALGNVTEYVWTPNSYAASIEPRTVHASRLIMFEGARTTARARSRNQGWSLSSLQRVVAVLKSFDGAWSSVDHMFADASQAVFKLQSLIQSLAEADGTGANDIQTRMALMDMLRSSGRAIVLDAGDENGNGGEEFEVIDRAALGGLSPMLEQYYIRIGAAAEMPLTVLLGVSPSGKDATGESDLILYYNRVEVERGRSVHPNFTRLVRLIAYANGIASPEKLQIKWPELYRPTPLDVATAEKMAVDAAVSLALNGIVLEEEVALSLKTMVPGLKLNIDPKARKQALAEAYQEIAMREMTGVREQPAEGEGPDNTPPAKASERKIPASTKGRQ
jgi:hypothetical protein